MITDERESIGEIRERNSLRNQIHSEFLQLKNPECIREKKQIEQEKNSHASSIDPLDRSIPGDGEKMEATSEIVPPASSFRNDRSSAFQTRIENSKLRPRLENNNERNRKRKGKRFEGAPQEQQRASSSSSSSSSSLLFQQIQNTAFSPS